MHAAYTGYGDAVKGEHQQRGEPADGMRDYYQMSPFISGESAACVGGAEGGVDSGQSGEGASQQESAENGK